MFLQSSDTPGMTKMRIWEVKDHKTYTKKGCSSIPYEKPLIKRQWVHGRKNALYIHNIIFPSHNSKGFQRKDSVVKATHFFFFISSIRWKSEPLKHLVNGRNGIGPGCSWGRRDGSEPNDRVTQLLTGQWASWWEMLQQTWPLHHGSVKNTVQGSKKQKQKP